MINEVLEVQDYLEGRNINKRCIYRICYMLAKWYKQQGMSHMDIRQSIFNWGKKYNIFITCNVNSIIYQALDDKTRLRDDIEIHISENDIKEITERFDSKNCRLMALAILCYAKCTANRDNEFNLSLLALSNWIGIDYNNLLKRHLPELVDFNYISRVDNNNKTYSWNKEVKNKSTALKIQVSVKNEGIYKLKDNNIRQLYLDIFQK